MRANSLSRLDDSSWKAIYTTDRVLPKTGEPPRELGGRVWFRDEGPGDGTPGRLSWVDLTPRSELRYFDQDTGWDGLAGLYFRRVWRYAQAPDQTVWILPQGGLVVSRGAHRYGTAILNGRPDFQGDRPDMPAEAAKDAAYILQPTAVEFEQDGCAKLATAAGPGGAGASLYRVCHGVVRPTLSFRRTEQVVATPDSQYHWGWVPTFILTIGEGTMVVAGEYGGLYLLTTGPDSKWGVKSLDEKPSRPIAF